MNIETRPEYRDSREYSIVYAAVQATLVKQIEYPLAQLGVGKDLSDEEQVLMHEELLVRWTAHRCVEASAYASWLINQSDRNNTLFSNLFLLEYRSEYGNVNHAGFLAISADGSCCGGSPANYYPDDSGRKAKQVVIGDLTSVLTDLRIYPEYIARHETVCDYIIHNLRDIGNTKPVKQPYFIHEKPWGGVITMDYIAVSEDLLSHGTRTISSHFYDAFDYENNQ